MTDILGRLRNPHLYLEDTLVRQGEMSDLHGTEDLLESAAAEIEGLRANNVKLDTMGAELKAEIERLRIDVRDQANVELSEENDRLIDEIERLRKEIEEWRIAAIKMRSQDEYDRLTDDAAAEIERLRDVVERLRGGTPLSAAVAEIEKLRGEVNEYDRIMMASKDEIERLRQQNELLRDYIEKNKTNIIWDTAAP